MSLDTSLVLGSAAFAARLLVPQRAARLRACHLWSRCFDQVKFSQLGANSD
jgi:hypothetical protein